MKHELDRLMSIVKDYKTGYGGVTDSFMRKELKMFAMDYRKEQCNIGIVSQQRELLKAFLDWQQNKYRKPYDVSPKEQIEDWEAFNCG